MMDHDRFAGRKIGNYRLVEKIGSGGFGSVYRAKHLYIDRIVAIKLLLRVQLNSELERDSFIKEARVLEKLKHPHILHLIDVGVEEEIPYLITDFAAGRSLEERLQRQSSRTLPLEEALPILLQTGDAIRYAHEQNIVHRDLKPANILFGAQTQVLLADFGIATILTEKNLKHTANIAGSPPYMAPELFDGIISKECDQYALACVAYELLTGKNPFNLPRFSPWGVWAQKHREENPFPPSKFNPNLPIHIEQAILKALAKDGNDRYPDIKSFVAALSATSSQAPTFPMNQASMFNMSPSETFLKPKTSSSNVSQKTIEQWIDEGAAHYKAKRYEEALICVEQAIDLDSKSANNYYLKGKILLQLQQPGRLWEAMAAFNQATYLKPKFAEAYIGKGDIYYHSFGNMMEALENYQHATRVAPKSAPGYYKMGIVLDDQARYAEALAAYDSALRFETQFPEIYMRKGNLLEHLQRYEEALTTYANAIQSVPKSPDAYIKKGELLERFQRYEEALTVWEQMIKLAPKSTDAYTKKGILLEHLQRYEEALTVWEQMIKLAPKSTDAYYRKAKILERLQRYEEALTVWEQIINLDPKSNNAYYRKGKTLEKLEGYELQYEGGPSIFKAFYDRLFPSQLYRDALQAYEHAISLRPEHSTYYVCKGNVLKYLGRINEAIHAYEKGSELEEAEKLNETKELEKGVQLPSVGNQRITKVINSRDDSWFKFNKSLVEYDHPVIYLAIFNPVLIPILLGIFLSSWLAFIIALICIVILTGLFIVFVDSLYTQLDAATWLLPASVVGIGWACTALLTIPTDSVGVKITLTIVSFFVVFFGNALLYLFIDIYWLGAYESPMK